jgi:hypothetical protein
MTAPSVHHPGPSIPGVSASAGIELLESRATSGGTTTRTIVARGNLISAPIAQLTVHGVDQDAAYRTFGQVVVSGAQDLRRSLSAFAAAKKTSPGGHELPEGFSS